MHTTCQLTGGSLPQACHSPLGFSECVSLWRYPSSLSSHTAQGSPHSPCQRCFHASWQGQLMGRGGRLAPEMQWVTGITAADTKGHLSQRHLWPGGVGRCCPVGWSCPAAGGNPADGRAQKIADRHKPHLIALRVRINQIMDKLLIGLT